MPARFVRTDHDALLLRQPGTREWGGPPRRMHFIMDAVGSWIFGAAKVNMLIQ